MPKVSAAYGDEGRRIVLIAPSRPVLRYHGGKWLIAPWIAANLPPHRTYVEPFGGAASVLIRKPRSYSEVYNDRWDMVVNVFEVLRDPEKAEQLKRELELTPFSRSDFEAIDNETLRSRDPVERARLTVFRSFAGFGSASTNGDFATGFRANSAKSGTTPAHDWVNYPGHVGMFTERLKGVIIENRDAVDVMLQHDGPETVHYVDPPYPHETRNMQRGNASYAFDMTDDDHRDLAKVLDELEGMVVLSGYRSEIYNELYGDWRTLEKQAIADGGRSRTEVLWMNSAAAGRSQGRLL